MFKKITNAVFVNHLFVDFFFDAREINFSALKRVVHLLCDREKVSGALNYAPLGAKTKAVHEQGERRNHLGHAASVIGRIEISHPQAFELPGFLANAVNVLASNERLVIFNLGDAIPRHLLNDSFTAVDTLASIASGD